MSQPSVLEIDKWKPEPEPEHAPQHHGDSVALTMKEPRQYDVISCLNVLDRCDKPLALIEDMRDSIVPVTGRIIIALVLPYHAFVELGRYGRCRGCCLLSYSFVGHGKYGKPTQYLSIQGETWEENVNSMSECFGSLGLEVKALSRTPYLCEGDLFKPYYTLRDTIFVLSRTQ